MVSFSAEFPAYLNNDMKLLCRNFFAEMNEMAEKEREQRMMKMQC